MKKLKVALIHDYLNEFGGAERVLQALSEMWPEAPIYTAFYKEGSPAYERFGNRKIVPSFVQSIPGFVDYLHSPLRFMAPNIWESFDLDEYDLVISSASWYITKGVITRPETVHICYCHTPPRYLYGYPTAVDWQKYWLVRQYARVVNHFMRQYDFLAAQRVDWFVANSENVRKRIEKYYRRDAVVIYPPVEVSGKYQGVSSKGKREYFLTGGRLVGAKNFELVIKAANKLQVSLKVYGDGPMGEELEELAGGTVEFVGWVDEEELAGLYGGAKAFVALAHDEDFGITPVEAQMCGAPVLAYRGGGYVESVVEGKTGVFVDELKMEAVAAGMQKIQNSKFKIQDLKRQGGKFSKERFKKEMRKYVNAKLKGVGSKG